MSEIIDARGLSCPQPVVLAKKALEKHSDITVIVDDTTALENVKRMGTNSGCGVEVAEDKGGTYRIRLVTNPDTCIQPSGEAISCGDRPEAGTTVIVFSCDQMGRGNDELGTVLMKSFIHTLTESVKLPSTMIFYNTGVKLAVKNSDVIDDLRKLEEKGTEILVCGTCANYFKIRDDIGAGVISNMYDISGRMMSAGRLLVP